MARPFLWFSLAMASIAATLAFGFGKLPGEMRDFEVYWTAAGRALEAAPLYRPDDGHFQFKYLPAFAVLAIPAALVPQGVAKAVWFTISAALIPLIVGLAVALLPNRRRTAAAVSLIVIVAMAKFYAHELVLGQVNLLFGVLAAAAILMVKHGYRLGAAALSVAAILIKPYAVIFLPWLAAAAGSGAAVSAGVGAAALLFIPAALYGLDGALLLHRQWWETVTLSTAPNLVNNDNVSVAGMFAKWFGIGEAASALTAFTCVALVSVATLVVFRRSKVAQPAPLEGALLLLLIPLISPQGWDYVFLIATPAVALFVNYDDLLPTAARWLTWTAIVVVGLSLFDVLGRERYAVFMSWSIISVCFLMLLSALSALRFRGLV